MLHTFGNVRFGEAALRRGDQSSMSGKGRSCHLSYICLKWRKADLRCGCEAKIHLSKKWKLEMNTDCCMER